MEIDGKVRYTQLARSLKTYGITFFVVKVGLRAHAGNLPFAKGLFVANLRRPTQLPVRFYYSILYHL